MTDSLTMFRRSMKHMLRSPDSLLTSMILPIVILLMFVYVFGGSMQVGTKYINYVLPGIILLCAGFGAAMTAVAVSIDMTEGIIDRFRTMAIFRPSILAGHVAASVVRNMITSAIVFGVGLCIGFRPNANPIEWLAAFGMLALFVLAISWLSVAIGLLAKNPEAANGFTFVLVFVPYVSSAFVPTSSMPTWLHGFAEHQPVTPVIETVRGLLMGTEIGSSATLAFAWCAAIALVGYTWATLVFRRNTAR